VLGIPGCRRVGGRRIATPRAPLWLHELVRLLRPLRCLWLLQEIGSIKSRGALIASAWFHPGTYKDWQAKRDQTSAAGERHEWGTWPLPCLLRPNWSWRTAISSTAFTKRFAISPMAFEVHAPHLRPVREGGIGIQSAFQCNRPRDAYRSAVAI
jgi:hypothetical protein